MRLAQRRELEEMRRLKDSGYWIDVGSTRWLGTVFEVRAAIFLWGDDDHDPVRR